MDWLRVRNAASGAFAAGLGIALAVVLVTALLVGFAHVFVYLADRT